MAATREMIRAPSTFEIPNLPALTVKDCNIIIPDDIIRHILSYADNETASFFACTSRDIRNAAVFLQVARGQFSLTPTTERHLVELSKKDGFNAHFQDLFASPCALGTPYPEWEMTFAKVRERQVCGATSTRLTMLIHVASFLVSQLGNIGNKPGRVPTGVTVGVLGVLKYGSLAQLEALAKLCGEEEGFHDTALRLEAVTR